MSAAERKKNCACEENHDALAELERMASEGNGGSLSRGQGPAGETGIDTSVLGEAAVKQGGG